MWKGDVNCLANSCNSIMGLQEFFIFVCRLANSTLTTGFLPPSPGFSDVRIAEWCEDRLLTVSAVYLPGALNILADRLSRMRPDVSDWMLDQSVFRQLQTIWDPQVDLFAANWN